MKKEQLIEALKMLARGRIDAAETVADLLMPESATFAVEVPNAPSVYESLDDVGKRLGLPGLADAVAATGSAYEGIKLAQAQKKKAK